MTNSIDIAYKEMLKISGKKEEEEGKGEGPSKFVGKSSVQTVL